MGNTLILGINCDGIAMIKPEDKFILYEYRYCDIESIFLDPRYVSVLDFSFFLKYNISWLMTEFGFDLIETKYIPAYYSDLQVCSNLEHVTTIM